MKEVKEKIRSWLGPCRSRSVTEAIGALSAQDDVISIVVMPDAHGCGSALNGVAVATNGVIYPELIGADIGCGYSAIRLSNGCDAFTRGEASLEGALSRLIPVFNRVVPTILRRVPLDRRTTASDDGAGGLSAAGLVSEAERTGRLQLGTLGRGNHFIELDLDEEGLAWVLVHSGSRGMGQKVFRHHAARAERIGENGLKGFEAGSPSGAAYWSDMEWCVRYASESRKAIIESITAVLSERFDAEPEEASFIDCPHNFGRREIHGGAEAIVHRKSVNSAAEGELGIIAGSMAAGARVVRGKGNPESLRSSAHGAGRTMSRSEAFRRVRKSEFLGSMRGVVFDDERERFLRDEAPKAYRDLDEVMRAQRDLVKTVAKLKPILNDKRG